MSQGARQRHRGPRARGAALGAALAATVLAGCGNDTATRSIGVTSVGGTAAFGPEELTVDKGDEIVITVSNPTDRAHGFSIAGYRVSEVVPPKETVEVRIDAARAGTFKIFCQLHETHRTATLAVR